MHIVERIMWALVRLLGNTFTAVGLVGLLLLTGKGLMWLTDRIINEEEMNHG